MSTDGALPTGDGASGLHVGNDHGSGPGESQTVPGSGVVPASASLAEVPGVLPSETSPDTDPATEQPERPNRFGQNQLVTPAELGRRGGLARAAHYRDLKKATTAQLTRIAAQDVPKALRDLVLGIKIMTKEGEVYRQPPDVKAIEIVLQRALGAVETAPAATASATVVNIIRNNVPDLNGEET